MTQTTNYVAQASRKQQAASRPVNEPFSGGRYFLTILPAAASGLNSSAGSD
jgi:hypothetical protein